MTKIKKVFLTITSALCCVVCAALAILGIVPEKTVQASTSTETVPVYDIAQMSANGPSANLGDAAWFNGTTKANGADVIAFNNAGYTAESTTVDETTTYTMKSVAFTFQMKTSAAFSAKANSIRLFICNTEIDWGYDATNGYYMRIWDATESSTPMRQERVNPNDTDMYFDSFDPTTYSTYKIVKSVSENATAGYDYTIDVYVNGTYEYTAKFTGITPKVTNTTWAVDQLRMRVNDALSVTVRSAHTLADVADAKDVYDYKQKDEYLSGKAFESTYDETTNTATENADVFDYTDMTDVSADSFGLTFKVKFDTDVLNKEILRARIGSTYDVRLSVVTPGANGKAQINAFDWQSNSATNKILGAAAYQFDIDLTQEHTYTFMKEKMEGTTSGYVYSAYIDGVLIQSAIYNVAPAASWGGSNDYNATNRMRITIQNGNYTGTFRSANYYGVKIDGDLNVVNANDSFTLSYTGDNLFFGFTDGTNFYKNNEQITEYKELTTLSMNVYNDKGAYVRFLHEGTASLKWTAHINKADLTKLQEAYGEENVIIERRVTADWDTDTEIRKTVAVADMVDNGTEYSFSQILSKIKQKNFNKDFNYTTVITVKHNDETLFTYEVENDNVRSIQTVATRAYEDVKTAEEWDTLTDAQKEQYKHLITVETDAYKDCYSKFSAAQRAILEQYLANVEA